MPRRNLDFYPTPEWATNTLLDLVDIDGPVLECCSGENDIANVLAVRGNHVFTNDIDLSRPSDWHFDATDPRVWTCREEERFDWVITNPPFYYAPAIIPLAYAHARVGIAMYLRITYLEPTQKGRRSRRGHWLAANPISDLIVLPRLSHTGDGKTDFATCAWMIWDKRQPVNGNRNQRILFIPDPSTY